MTSKMALQRAEQRKSGTGNGRKKRGGLVGIGLELFGLQNADNNDNNNSNNNNNNNSNSSNNNINNQDKRLSSAQGGVRRGITLTDELKEQLNFELGVDFDKVAIRAQEEEMIRVKQAKAKIDAGTYVCVRGFYFT